MEWVRAVVATTLGVAPMGELPPIIMQQEVGSIWDQIRKPLTSLGINQPFKPSTSVVRHWCPWQEGAHEWCNAPYSN